MKKNDNEDQMVMTDANGQKLVEDAAYRRLLEAAEMASSAKSNFLANMSHEIRTPMNSIMGFVELAQDSDSISQIKEYLSRIADSAVILLRIINDVLDISKIESGKMELERVPFNLHEIFSRCQSVILPSIKEKNLGLKVNAEPLIGRKLMGDPIRLYQALINLLSNAVKFTESGTVHFSSSIKNPSVGTAPNTAGDIPCSDGGSVTMYFEVKDSGIGMLPDQIEKVFEPFTQADSSTTRTHGGTGLGLAITKRIVELMGGKLDVKSSPGVGSKFSFEVTFETIESADDRLCRENATPIAKPHFDGLVLVCDDNQMNQEVICEHLTRLGLRTVVVENGKIAVDTTAKRKKNGEKPFDLIFMDMFMPVMDGMEAASKIKELNTGTPIVAMTANIMAGELEKYKKNGMPDCLGKPFTSQELWSILLKYLTPSGNMQLSDQTAQLGEEDLKRKLQVNFVKNNQTVFADITEAVAAGDTELAHRLAHTLKGNAGLIGKTGLRNAASEVESLLKDRISSVWDSKMNILNAELTLVLEELKPLLRENEADKTAANEGIVYANMDQVRALFERLDVMLENINPECIKLLDDIRAIPGTSVLARHIEDFDFEAAANALSELWRTLPEINLH